MADHSANLAKEVNGSSTVAGRYTQTSAASEDPINQFADDVCSEPLRHINTRRTTQVREQNMLKRHNSKANYRVTVIECLAFLASSLLFLSSGLLCVSQLARGELNRAKLELMNHSDIRATEQFVYNHLDQFLDSRLTRGVLENHTQCLERGIFVADDELFGLGHHFTDIRSKMVDWVEDNCGRLMHAPSVQSTSWQTDLKQYWSLIDHASRRVVEAFYLALKTATTDMWCRMVRRGWMDNASENEIRRESTPVPTLQSTRVSGFAVSCKSSGPCRLVDTMTNGPFMISTAVSEEDIEAIQRKIAESSTFSFLLKTYHDMIMVLVNIAYLVQAALLMVSAVQSDYGFSNTFRFELADAQSPSILLSLVHYILALIHAPMLKWLIMELYTITLHWRCSTINYPADHLHNWAFILFLTGATMLVLFFFGSPFTTKPPHAQFLARAARRLRAPAPTPILTTSVHTIASQQGNSASKTSCYRSQSPYPPAPAKFIFQADLEADLELRRRERDMHTNSPVSQSDCTTDSESESASESEPDNLEDDEFEVKNCSSLDVEMMDVEMPEAADGWASVDGEYMYRLS
ncbi:hypothetical protein ACN47E_004416 [Coniothyrium glycines]